MHAHNIALQVRYTCFKTLASPKECLDERTRSQKIVDWTFFSFHRASRPTPETFTTLKRTPGISPFALPRRPKPEIRTSSFSSTKFKQPSFYRQLKSLKLERICY